MHIKLAESSEDILKCWSVIKELRPHLDKDNFLNLINKMKSEGYILAYIELENIAVSAIGFRYVQFLYNGQHYYIDDLVTLSNYRSKGYAKMLLDFVCNLAKEKGFTSVTLDSGHQRFAAHKLYLSEGFNIIAHHFVKNI
jgi:ribosomal protein S18 acetylase RimI-like enzyme